MKSLAFTLLLAIAPLTSYAAAPTKFTCGSTGHGTAFKVQFGGPRYGDPIHVGYLGQDLRPFLPANEQSLQTSSESVDLIVSVGSCRKVENSDVLVSCESDANGWIIADYRFTTVDNITPEFHQTNKISRNFRVSKLDLKVVKENKDAKLVLKLTASFPDRTNTEIKIERNLGTLEHDWYTCQFSE